MQDPNNPQNPADQKTAQQQPSNDVSPQPVAPQQPANFAKPSTFSEPENKSKMDNDEDEDEDDKKKKKDLFALSEKDDSIDSVIKQIIQMIKDFIEILTWLENKARVEFDKAMKSDAPVYQQRAQQPSAPKPENQYEPIIEPKSNPQQETKGLFQRISQLFNTLIAKLTSTTNDAEDAIPDAVIDDELATLAQQKKAASPPQANQSTLQNPNQVAQPPLSAMQPTPAPEKVQQQAQKNNAESAKPVQAPVQMVAAMHELIDHLEKMQANLEQMAKNAQKQNNEQTVTTAIKKDMPEKKNGPEKNLKQQIQDLKDKMQKVTKAVEQGGITASTQNQHSQNQAKTIQPKVEPNKTAAPQIKVANSNQMVGTPAAKAPNATPANTTSPAAPKPQLNGGNKQPGQTSVPSAFTKQSPQNPNNSTVKNNGISTMPKAVPVPSWIAKKKDEEKDATYRNRGPQNK